MAARAVEGRFVVISHLKAWAESGLLSYKFSVLEDSLQPKRVRATFSKPTPAEPSPAAVAHLYFHLDDRLQRILGFTVESETHFHSLTDLRFDEAILDQVIRRKLALKRQQPALVNLADGFSSTRIPAVIAARREEQRELDREGLEEHLLERFHRKDPYNEGRISFDELRDVLQDLELEGVGRREREILFAFVELDREDMVDYGALVAIGAEVLDTLVHTAVRRPEPPPMEELLEAFRTANKYHQYHTIDTLERLLEDMRAPRRDGPGDPEEKKEEEPDEQLDESSAEKDAATVAASSPWDEDKSTSRDKAEQCVTRRELRGLLESPQLMLSKAEINLLVAVATPTAAGQIACAQLGELLQHVQSMIFRFQVECFSDRLDRYLLDQFIDYETSKLQGSSEHLKMRLRQREIKAVVKDMKKLLLSPFQFSEVVTILQDDPTDIELIIQYKDRIALVVAHLQRSVSLDELIGRAEACQMLQHGDTRHVSSLSDASTVRSMALETFEGADDAKRGVLSLSDFVSSLGALSHHVAVELDTPSTIDSMCALADPLGQGRVNYTYFQHLIYPIAHRVEFEKSVARLRQSGRVACSSERKECDDDVDEAK